MNRRSRYKATS